MANALAELGLLGIFRVKMKRVVVARYSSKQLNVTRCYKPANFDTIPDSERFEGVLEICIRRPRSLAIKLLDATS